jgi:hypothetical protein
LVDIISWAKAHNLSGRDTFQIGVYSKIIGLESIHDNLSYFFPNAQFQNNISLCQDTSYLSVPKVVYVDPYSECVTAYANYNSHVVLGSYILDLPNTLDLARYEFLQ